MPLTNGDCTNTTVSGTSRRASAAAPADWCVAERYSVPESRVRYLSLTMAFVAPGVDETGWEAECGAERRRYFLVWGLAQRTES